MGDGSENMINGVQLGHEGVTRHSLKSDRPMPALDMAATLGCLLALVREAWGDEGVTVRCDSTTGVPPARWWVRLGIDQQTMISSGATEAHALVAALETAPWLVKW